jgi:hypothetical protein
VAADALASNEVGALNKDADRQVLEAAVEVAQKVARKRSNKGARARRTSLDGQPLDALVRSEHEHAPDAGRHVNVSFRASA